MAVAFIVIIRSGEGLAVAVGMASGSVISGWCQLHSDSESTPLLLILFKRQPNLRIVRNDD